MATRPALPRAVQLLSSWFGSHVQPCLEQYIFPIGYGLTSSLAWSSTAPFQLAMVTRPALPGAVQLLSTWLWSHVQPCLEQYSSFPVGYGHTSSLAWSNTSFQLVIVTRPALPGAIHLSNWLWSHVQPCLEQYGSFPIGYGHTSSLAWSSTAPFHLVMVTRPALPGAVQLLSSWLWSHVQPCLEQYSSFPVGYGHTSSLAWSSTAPFQLVMVTRSALS